MQGTILEYRDGESPRRGEYFIPAGFEGPAPVVL